MTRLIVSLTSYGDGVNKLSPSAIASILRQSIKPDMVILWVAYGTRIGLRLRLLKLKGLTINTCEDIGPSTKALPAMMAYPNDIIVTADDDIIYPSNWLEGLVNTGKSYPGKIVAHRAHRVTLDRTGSICPYDRWEKCVQSNNRGDDYGLFPTGVGGVLYPPGSIPESAFDIDTLKRLTYKNDDIWLWAMANINDSYFKGRVPYVVVPDGYSNNLRYVDPERESKSLNTLSGQNVLRGGNDQQINNVISEIPGLKSLLSKLVTRVV